jgi:hypothetical protein
MFEPLKGVDSSRSGFKLVTEGYVCIWESEILSAFRAVQTLQKTLLKAPITLMSVSKSDGIPENCNCWSVSTLQTDSAKCKSEGKDGRK